MVTSVPGHLEPGVNSHDRLTASDRRAKAHELAQLPDPDTGKTDAERRAIDAKLVRKIDLRLIPWLALVYLMSFLCRTNIGNARGEHLEAGLGMSGAEDYNLALTIFFIGYAIAEPLTNALLKRSTPRLFFTGIVVAWGLVMTLTGLCTTFRDLLAARWFLGVAEGGLYPGVNFYLSCWYRPSEMGLRSALFFAAAALAGAFGGLLAALITNNLDGAARLPGWAWIFIIEGIATVLVGLCCWWMIFDWPDTARFLSPQDRVRVQRRLLAARQSKAGPEKFDRRHIYAALRDWKTYGYMFIYMGTLCPLYAFALFLPTILAAMGYQGTTLQLMSVPPYAVGAATTILVGYLSDRTHMRGFCNMLSAVVAIVGFVLLLASADSQMQYIGTFLGAAGIYPTVSNTLSWVVDNTEGALKRAVVIGMVVGWGNLNGVVSSNIYRSNQSPRYWAGHGTVLAYLILSLFGGSVFMHVTLRAQNNRKKASVNAKWEALTEEQRLFMGDKSPFFHYNL